MKKFITGLLIFSVVLLVSVGILFYTVWLPISRADTAAMFASGLKEYAICHSLLLPEKWSDYVSWCVKTKKWQISESNSGGRYLDEMYVIRHRDLNTGSDTTLYLEVLDPKIKKQELYLNQTINSARYEIKSNP